MSGWIVGYPCLRVKSGLIKKVIVLEILKPLSESVKLISVTHSYNRISLEYPWIQLKIEGDRLRVSAYLLRFRRKIQEQKSRGHTAYSSCLVISSLFDEAPQEQQTREPFLLIFAISQSLNITKEIPINRIEWLEQGTHFELMAKDISLFYLKKHQHYQWRELVGEWKREKRWRFYNSTMSYIN